MGGILPVIGIEIQCKDNFQEWLEEKFLPKLESPSIIVMDNPEYQKVEFDKKPNTAFPCFYIVYGMSKHVLNFNNSVPRINYFSRQKGSQKHYVVNEIMMKHGYFPLHLSPFHPDLNPSS